MSLIDQALPLLGVRELAVTSWMAGVGVRGAFEALSFLRVDMRMDAGTPAFSLESFYEVSGWWLQTSLGLELGVGRKARFFVRPGLSLELMDFERREEEVFTGEPEEIWKVKSTEPGVCLGAGFSVAMSDRMGLQLFLHLNYALTPHEGTYTRYWPLSPDQRYRITSRLSFLFSVAFHVRF